MARRNPNLGSDVWGFTKSLFTKDGASELTGTALGLGISLALAHVLVKTPVSPATKGTSYKTTKMLATAGGGIAAMLLCGQIGEKAGRAAFIGGLMALGIQAIGIWGGITIGEPRQIAGAKPAQQGQGNQGTTIKP